MRADYDSEANTISITLAPVDHAERADQVHERAIVALHDGHPVGLQLLYLDLGVEEPIAAVAARCDLDRGVAAQLGHSPVLTLSTYGHLIAEYAEAAQIDAEREIILARDGRPGEALVREQARHIG